MDKERYDAKIASFYEKLCKVTLDEAHVKAVEGGRTITRGELAKKLYDYLANIQSDSVLEEPTPEPEPEVEIAVTDDDDEKE